MIENVPMRNHPSVIIQNTVTVALMMIFLCIIFMTTEMYIISAAVIILWSAVCIVFWARQSIVFDEKDITVIRNAAFKRKKVVPYEKIATVNVVRNIYNRIFGTVTLRFNINSSVNAAVPEISFCFKMDEGERIRDFVSNRMFTQSYRPQDAEERDSVVSFSPAQVLMHGIFSMPTLSIVYTSILLVYSVVSSLVSNGSGIMIAITLLVLGEVIPVASLVLKYYNFKVYRIDDTIYLQHGAIQTYRSAFNVSRINAIRIKRPLFARLMHRSCLEAEVIGINAVSNDVRPVLCLLIDDERLTDVIGQLVPELVRDYELQKQPKEAKTPIYAKTAVISSIFIAAMAYPAYYMYEYADNLIGPSPLSVVLMKAAIPAFVSVSVILMYYGAMVSLRVCTFGISGELFTLENGVVDREKNMIQFDRVQISRLHSGPVARRYGLAKCEVSLLSSAGGASVRSGYFSERELSKISSIMLERIANGEYDFRKSSV
ncbi:MAG: PH domain-containing protein [Candidatus Methanomethylophilaceae archaeon]